MPSALTRITAPDGVAAGLGYAQVVFGSGRLVVVSGQVALTVPAGWSGLGDPSAQTRQVFSNIKRCLAAAGATFDHVMKLTYYVTDIGFLPSVRAVRDEFPVSERPPASTAVQVAALFRPDLLSRSMRGR